MTSSFAFQASTRILTRNRIGPDSLETTSEGGFRNGRFRSPDSPAPSGRSDETHKMRFHQKIGSVWTVPRPCAHLSSTGILGIRKTSGHLWVSHFPPCIRICLHFLYFEWPLSKWSNLTSPLYMQITHPRPLSICNEQSVVVLDQPEAADRKSVV